MKVSICPPGILNAAVEGTFGLYEAIARGAGDYFAGAVARQASPVDMSLDVLTWIQTSTRREPPRWASEHTVLAEWPIARLRDFSSPHSGETTPTPCSSLRRRATIRASSTTHPVRARS